MPGSAEAADLAVPLMVGVAVALVVARQAERVALVEQAKQAKQAKQLVTRSAGSAIRQMSPAALPVLPVLSALLFLLRRSSRYDDGDGDASLRVADRHTPGVAGLPAQHRPAHSARPGYLVRHHAFPQ